MAVDGGAVHEILSYLEQNDLILSYVTNTHSHSDHTSGNVVLLKKTGAEFIPVTELPGRGFIDIEGREIQVMSTPGHTEDSVCFHHGTDLLTGDTLFNGKVGRCFTGDVESFYASIEKILVLPEGASIYAAMTTSFNTWKQRRNWSRKTS